MFYIHQATCISPQHTFDSADMDTLVESVDNKLYAIEPKYNDIPVATLRRMGKAVRLGVGAALPLVKNNEGLSGVVIGTANGGLEDCIKFLNQIIQYDEGTLTPTNFVQSTSNAVAAQIGMYGGNKGYNITHVHRGHAFENALLDVQMLLMENPEARYLLGGVEEISIYNYNIQILGGWYKAESISSKKLYETQTAGSIAGEGAAMFVVDSHKGGAVAKCDKFSILHSQDVSEVREYFDNFIRSEYEEEIDLILTGESGDVRQQKFYDEFEKTVGENSIIARFKHMTGEHQSSMAIAFWLAWNIIRSQQLPAHMIKRGLVKKEIKRIVIYNTYEGNQHSIIAISKA